MANTDPPEPKPDEEEETLLKKLFPQLDMELGNLLGPSLRDGAYHTTDGFAKGFLAYLVPTSLLRRQILTNLRRAIAFGIFVGGVRAMMTFLKRISSQEDMLPESVRNFVRRYHLAIGGGVATFVAIAVDGSVYNSSLLIFWLLVRALKSHYVPVWGDKGVVARIVPTLILMLSSAYKLPTWNFDRKAMDYGQIKFLDYHGGKPRKQLDGFVEGIPSPCPSVIHPGQSCAEHAISYWPQSFKRAIKMYIPVYIFILFFSRRRSLSTFVFNLLRSSTFLATYCTSAWVWACIFYRFSGPVTIPRVAFHSSLTGLAGFIERPSRAAELATYEITYVADSLYKRAVRAGYIKQSSFINMIVMSLAAALLLHNHKHQPQFLMKWLFKIAS